MNQDVKIDREGLHNIRTGERSTMILADELEVSAFFLYNVCLPTSLRLMNIFDAFKS